MTKWIIKTKEQASFLHGHILKDLETANFVELEIKTPIRTTDSQYKAMQLWCRMVGSGLNDCGLDQRTVLSESTAIPWDGDSVRENMWNKILKAKFNKESSKDMTTDECAATQDILIRHLASLGYQCPEWPHKD